MLWSRLSARLCRRNVFANTSMMSWTLSSSTRCVFSSSPSSSSSSPSSSSPSPSSPSPSSSSPSSPSSSSSSSSCLLQTHIIRNVAIIAHVDHGKTTLVNELMSQTGMKVANERTMDSIAQEQERGITIMSKCTRLKFKDHILNVVDTPGHADFGGEVERVLSMVDGVILVVDASEGVMPQTKFVLGKALQAKLRPVIVINKVDKEARRVPGGVENEIFDLFVSLDADDDQLEFPVLYASAKNGWAVVDLEADEKAPNKTIKPVLDAIISNIPAPMAVYDAPFRLLVTSIEHDDYLGRIVTGKVREGSCVVGDAVKALTIDAKDIGLQGRVTKIMVREGLNRVTMDRACAGDIVSISGLRANVTDTLCAPEVTEALKAQALDPPTISMTFGVNDSPLAGLEGTKLTATVLKARLESECENNVAISLKINKESEAVEVQGRGELQMGILIDQMRREGFEMGVSPPRVLMRKIANGDITEPIEEVTIDVEPEFSSTVIDKMQRRGADMIEFNNDLSDRSRLVFRIPSRRFIGYRSEFQTDTRGNGVMCSVLHSYEKMRGAGPSIRKGVIVSMAKGKTTAFSLASLEARGQLFVGPNQACYEGMVIGECARDTDINVNPTKGKKLSNMRSAGNDEGIRLAPCKPISIEGALSYMAQDEMVEVTPKSVRLRKRVLAMGPRLASEKRKRNGAEVIMT